MEQVQNAPRGGKWVEYGKFTFLDVSHEIKTIDTPPDVDEWVAVDMSPKHRLESWRPLFTGPTLGRNPGTAAAWKEFEQQTKLAAGQFLDGTMDADSLTDVFQQGYQHLTDVAKDTGYPSPLWDKMMGPARLESIYGEFRRMVLDAAVQQNNQEGRQYVTGEMTSQRTYKYYNSDYYYKTEEALAAVTDRYTALIQEAGWEDYISVPDYKGKGLNLYYNFNTAFSNKFDVNEQYMLDPDQASPRDFQWFYQTGGGDGKTGIVDSCTIYHLDGTTTYEDYTGPEFDPKHPAKANMWAAYRDEDGVRHQVSVDFQYHFVESDLRNVASLLRFPGDSAAAQSANRFLQNLQVYSPGHFSRFPTKKSGFQAYV